MTLRILTVGDVVGHAGLSHLQATLHAQKKALDVDLCIVNGENASEIKGICKADAELLLLAGADVITLGNHAYSAPDIGNFLDDHADVIIRPANFPAHNPGYGYTITNVNGVRVLCINMLGTVNMQPLDNPFLTMERILDAQKGNYDIALLDMHAEATSEKYAMARAFDGKIAVIFGTHTHVPTADLQILPGGTGYITDLGMCGPEGGIIGAKTEPVLKMLRDHMPARFSVADGRVRARAALFCVDTDTGRTTSAKQLIF